MKKNLLIAALIVGIAGLAVGQKNEISNVEIVTADIDNFWKAYDAAKPEFNPDVFQKLYLDVGTPGLKSFVKSRIKSAENIAKVIRKRPIYYASLRQSTGMIRSMEPEIKDSFRKMKLLYPKMQSPKVYFVIGVMNSGGTGFHDGLIIGTEMYGRTKETSEEELSDWLKTVLKPVNEIPHIVAHELVHNFQDYDGGSLLAACIKEGGADYIAELISGSHINQYVHDFAEPKEKELWLEFKERMLQDDYDGWLYSATKDRPNDLGYWMGYKITKAYFDTMTDKTAAMEHYLNIKDFEKFLEESGYPKKFKD
jgi:hypothetical protein